MTTVNSGQASPGVTPRFTQAILQTAERGGVSLPEELVQAAQAEQRVSLALQDQLWDSFCERSSNPLVGLELGLAVQVGHLDAAGMLLMTCETLGEALEFLLDYHPIVGEGGSFECHRQGNACALLYHPYYERRRAQRVEAVFACLLRMIRWSTGEAFQPGHLGLAHAPLAEPARYVERLAVPVWFEQPDNALEFPVAGLDLPLIQSNPELCRHVRTLADELLAGLGSQSVSARVRGLLREHPRWSKDRVADNLHMSGRHLVRKLAGEGTSFKLLRAGLLRALAERDLRDDLSTAEVSERLGFSDESAFIKAFKRWAGVTPAQFRTGAAD